MAMNEFSIIDGLNMAVIEHCHTKTCTCFLHNTVPAPDKFGKK